MTLAVYGTLRRGGSANGLLRGAKYLGQDRINGKLYNLSEGIPAVLPSASGTVVVDLYELPEGAAGEEMIKVIDVYEGYYPDKPDQSLYRRKETVTVEGSMPVQYYEYRFEVNIAHVPSGDYFKREDYGTVKYEYPTDEGGEA